MGGTRPALGEHPPDTVGGPRPPHMRHPAVMWEHVTRHNHTGGDLSHTPHMGRYEHDEYWY
jgi:hypothetical protein